MKNKKTISKVLRKAATLFDSGKLQFDWCCVAIRDAEGLDDVDVESPNQTFFRELYKKDAEEYECRRLCWWWQDFLDSDANQLARSLALHLAALVAKSEGL